MSVIDLQATFAGIRTWSTCSRNLYRWILNDMGKWLIIAVLLGLLALALWDGYEQWILVVASVPAWGWLLMALGGGLSIALGVGLTALTFYSSRKGYDESPRVVEPDDKSSS